MSTKTETIGARAHFTPKKGVVEVETFFQNLTWGWIDKYGSPKDRYAYDLRQSIAVENLPDRVIRIDSSIYLSWADCQNYGWTDKLKEQYEFGAGLAVATTPPLGLFFRVVACLADSAGTPQPTTLELPQHHFLGLPVEIVQHVPEPSFDAGYGVTPLVGTVATQHEVSGCVSRRDEICFLLRLRIQK